MATISATALKFHFGLSVGDLKRSVEFYRILLGADPVKQFDDYAKFETDDPPIVLALHPGRTSSGGALNHVGFRVANSEVLVAIQERLERQGIRTQREEGVECCYALQTKFWVPDPDRNLWEIYTLHADLDHSGFGDDGHGMPPRPDFEEPTLWEHKLTQPLPETIPHADGSVDEVRLEGTFNACLTADRRREFLCDIFRVLKPGGRIWIHGLVSNVPFPGVPALPGPAAMVESIPVETEPASELRAVGFENFFYERLGDIHCFSVGGVELRELQLIAAKPQPASPTDRFVLYRGPLSALVDDNGKSYPRGVRIPVDAATWNRFHQAPYADQMTCFPCAADR